MKNKFMKVMATIAAAVLPFTSASALTVSTNYYSYDMGQEVNFYVNPQEEAAHGKGGVTGLIMEDKGTSDKFVYTFAYSIIATTTAGYDEEAMSLQNEMSTLNLTPGEESSGDDYLKDYSNATMISKDEAIKLFDAKEESATSYTIDVSKQVLAQDGKDYKTLGNVFQTIGDSLSARNYGVTGFLTSTEENGKVWVVTFDYTAGADSVANAKLVQVTTDSIDNTYAAMPMLYFNKTADCHERSMTCYVCTDGSYSWSNGTDVDTSVCKPDTSITSESQCTSHACYDCSGKYTWTEVGKQDSSCKLIPGVTSESKCVVSPKTGVSSHILEFGIVASICTAVLLVVKRKDIFKAM